MPKNIFISYAHSDSASAAQLATLLSERGVNVWRDTEMLKSGEQWAKTIMSALEQAKALVAFLPNRSEQGANNVLFEIGAASALKLPTFVVIDSDDDFEPSQLSVAAERVKLRRSDEESLQDLASQLTQIEAA